MGKNTETCGVVARRRLWRKRICFVCLGSIPEGKGMCYQHLDILTHQGACAVRADGELRVFDRSPRGRWRRRGDVLMRLVAQRPAPGSPSGAPPDGKAWQSRNDREMEQAESLSRL